MSEAKQAIAEILRRTFGADEIQAGGVSDRILESIDPDRLRPMLSMKQVILKLSLSRATIGRMVQDGRFPKPVALTPGRVGWFEDDVTAWQKTLKVVV